jgi:hypothetical protein
MTPPASQVSDWVELLRLNRLTVGSVALEGLSDIEKLQTACEASLRTRGAALNAFADQQIVQAINQGLQAEARITEFEAALAEAVKETARLAAEAQRLGGGVLPRLAAAIFCLSPLMLLTRSGSGLVPYVIVAGSIVAHFVGLFARLSFRKRKDGLNPGTPNAAAAGPQSTANPLTGNLGLFKAFDDGVGATLVLGFATVLSQTLLMVSIQRNFGVVHTLTVVHGAIAFVTGVAVTGAPLEWRKVRNKFQSCEKGQVTIESALLLEKERLGTSPLLVSEWTTKKDAWFAFQQETEKTMKAYIESCEAKNV